MTTRKKVKISIGEKAGIVPGFPSLEKRYNAKGALAVKLRIIFENLMYLVDINTHPSNENRIMRQRYFAHFKECEREEMR